GTTICFAGCSDETRSFREGVVGTVDPTEPVPALPAGEDAPFAGAGATLLELVAVGVARADPFSPTLEGVTSSFVWAPTKTRTTRIAAPKIKSLIGAFCITEWASFVACATSATGFTAVDRPVLVERELVELVSVDDTDRSEVVVDPDFNNSCNWRRS